MTTLFLTFNFFLRDWHTDEGEVWGILQPHIVETKDSSTFETFYDWVKESTLREKSDFEFWRKAPCASGTVVPVPFPDKSSISVRLYTDEDNALTTPQGNDLSSLAWILDTKRFALANLEPQQINREWDSSAKDSTGGSCPADLVSGPFSLGYNNQLREAGACAQDKNKGDGDLLRLPGMLQLAFWGGRRQRVPKVCLKPGSLTRNIMQLPRTGDEGEVILTNLHSLLGLTFKLGDKKNQAELQKVIRIEFEVNGKLISSGTDPHGKPNEQRLDVSGFFSSLDDNSIVDPSTIIPVPGIEDRSQVAYVRQGFVSLQRIAGTAYFQIPVTGSIPGGCAPDASKSNAWTQPTRFVVRAPADTKKDSQTWQAFMGFEGVLKRYRLAPAKTNEPHKGRTILQFVPSKKNSKAFYSYLETKNKDSDMSTLFGKAHFLVALSNDAKSPTLVSRPIDQGGGLWFLGLYDLPWDRSRAKGGGLSNAAANDKTVVLLGELPADQNVRLLFPEGGSFHTNFIQEDTKTTLDKTSRNLHSHLGDRWELQGLVQNQLPPSEFNVVMLSDADPKQAVSRSGDLAPSLCFPGLLEFDFAQCIGAIEGKIDVKYPSYSPDSSSASNTLLRDLLNYNALIVEKDGNRENPFGQILPVNSTMLAASCQDPHGGGVQSFEFRFEPPTDAPIRYKVESSAVGILPGRFTKKVTNARDFFKHTYNQMGVQYTLSFGIEHTLGPSLAPSIQATMKAPAFVDYPVAMPAEVVLRPEPDKTRKDENIPFLQVSCDMSSGDLQVTLHFQTQWLTDSEFGSDSHRETHIAACRAVAELASAKSITIKPRVYTFDYRRALDLVNQGESPSGLGGGLLVLEDNPGWDCTKDLNRLCSLWLDTPPANGVPTEWNCSHAQGFLKNHPDLLFVEFEMVLERDPKTTPPDNDMSKWRLQWRPLPPSLAKADIDLANDHWVSNAFAAYLSSLKSKCVVIPAKRSMPIEKDFIAGAAALLGTNSGASGGWIFQDPKQFVESHKTVDMSAIVCPLAFSPLPRHPILGDDTSEIVNRYMEKLDALLSYDPAWETAQTQEVNSDLLAKIRASFITREALAKKPDQANKESAKLSLWPVMDAAVGRLFPATSDGDDVNAIASVKGTGSLRDDVREAVLERLWASPRVFGDAKGFLLTLIQGGTLKQPTGLDPELVFSRISKVTSPQARDNTARPISDAIRETDSRRDTLRILEFLDDSRYNDEFSLESVERKDLRGLLQEGISPANPKASATWTKLPSDNLKLPRSSRNSKIYLPTREPIVPPAHLYSGYVEDLQSKPPDLESVEFNKLTKGVWAGPSPSHAGPLASRIVHSSLVQRTTRPDETWFSMLYWIVGERHKRSGSPAISDGLAAFANDTFVLYESETGWDQPGENAQPQVQSDEPTENKKNAAQSFFHGVLSADEGEALPSALDSGNLERLRQVLEGQFEDKTLMKDKKASVSFRIVANKNKGASVVWVSPPNNRFEVVVFALSGSKSPQGPRPRLLLLVNAKVDLWSPRAFRLLHRRNFSYFDDHFRQEAVAGGTPFAYQRSVVRDFATDLNPIPVSWRKKPLGNLIEEVLIPRCFPNAPKPHATKFDLSVTVRRLHRIVSLVESGNGAISTVSRDLEGENSGQVSSFPLENNRYGNGNQHPRLTDSINWFPDGTNDFLVDFQWSSPTNLQFLRLSGVRVFVKQ